MLCLWRPQRPRQRIRHHSKDSRNSSFRYVFRFFSYHSQIYTPKDLPPLLASKLRYFETGAQRQNSKVKYETHPSPNGEYVRHTISVHDAGAVESLMDQASGAVASQDKTTSPSFLKSALQNVGQSTFNFVLGGFAGATGAAFVYPIDLVKT